ncbi:MAG TPA: hypothetical protein PLL53_16705 [Saprospiraceae bacterium]|nr:hypothetical protein [Saprospiraceae bacterium]
MVRLKEKGIRSSPSGVGISSRVQSEKLQKQKQQQTGIKRAKTLFSFHKHKVYKGLQNGVCVSYILIDAQNAAFVDRKPRFNLLFYCKVPAWSSGRQAPYLM